MITASDHPIAATNRTLDKAVASGEFRADLYYRLNVFDIRIQPYFGSWYRPTR